MSKEAGYRQMAQDEEREAEALAWSESLIGDVVEIEGLSSDTEASGQDGDKSTPRSP
jgi:hypothetical protein